MPAKTPSHPRMAANAKRNGEHPPKHLFVTGGVVSSLGKGITSASIGRLLVNMGYTVRIQKLDPYLNVDPGTMNPFQHGEVYVTDDGAECDLDLGHYERFLNQPCTRHSTVTSGQIYQAVIQQERAGRYNGGTVQVIPHITNEIKEAIDSLAGDDVDVLITENGGPVRLWRNELNPRDHDDVHFLRVKLEGMPHNRDALGARIVAVSGDRRQERRIRIGGSYLSQSETVATFGLGPSSVVDTLYVYWPDGEFDTLVQIPANQELHLARERGPSASMTALESQAP